MKSTISGLACFALLSGCVATSSSHAGAKSFDEPTIRALQRGTTTSAVIQRLGEPQRKDLDVDGAEVWTYASIDAKSTVSTLSQNTVVVVTIKPAVLRFMWDKMISASLLPTVEKRHEGSPEQLMQDLQQVQAMANQPPAQLGKATADIPTRFKYTREHARPKLEKEYDKFEDKTTIEMGPLELDENEFFNMSLLGVFKKGVQDPKYLLALDYIGSGWKFLRNHDLYMLVDGERSEFETHHNGEAHSGSIVSERMICTCSLDFLKKMSVAKTLEGKLGFRVFSLRRGQIEQIKKFVIQVEAGPDKDIGESPLEPVETRFSFGDLSAPLPQNWKVFKDYLGFSILLCSPQESEQDAVTEYVGIAVTDAPPGKSLDESFNDGANNFKSTQQGFEDLAREPAKVNDIEARKLSFAIRRNDIKVKGFSYLFHHGGKRYSVNCFAEEGKFAKYQPIFEKLIEGIQLKG